MLLSWAMNCRICEVQIMNDKLFYRLLTIITVLGIASVAALVIITWLLQKDCSVISYIANKG